MANEKLLNEVTEIVLPEQQKTPVQRKRPIGATGSFGPDPLTREQFGQIGGAITPSIIPQQASQFLPEQIRTPVEAGQQRFQELMGRSAVSGINTAAFNAPRVLAKKAGVDILPTPTGKEETVADITGSVAGGVAGGPGKVFKAVTNAKKLETVFPVVRDLIGGAITGGLWTPESGSIEEDLMTRARNAGIGGGSAMILGVGVRAIRDLGRLVSATKQKNFLKQLRNTIIGSDKAASTQFGKKINELQKSEPQKKVDIRQAKQDIMLETAGGKTGDTKLRNAVGRSKTLQRAFKDNQTELSLRESQNIINELEDTLPQRVYRGDINTNEREIINLIKILRDAQDISFAGMPQVRADFRSIREPFNQIKDFTQKGKMGAGVTGKRGEIAGKGGLFDRDIEWMAEELPKLMPHKLIQQLGGVRGGNNFIKALGRIFSAVITGTVAGGVARGAISNANENVPMEATSN